MEMTDAKVVEKKIYEEGKKHDDYASKATGNAGLTLGIIGTALGAGAWLFGGNRSVFGSLGGNMPENVNINAYGYGANANANQPTALQVMEKECADEVKLLTDMFGLKLDTANKFYAMRETDIAEKFGLYKSQVDAINAENRRAIDAEFGLYKAGRDQYDATNAKMAALETKIAVMEALAPYKEKILLQAMDLKTAYDIKGQLVLPSTPTVTGYGSYCCCKAASTPTTGA
jgi:hypothetical protein